MFGWFKPKPLEEYLPPYNPAIVYDPDLRQYVDLSALPVHGDTGSFEVFINPIPYDGEMYYERAVRRVIVYRTSLGDYYVVLISAEGTRVTGKRMNATQAAQFLVDYAESTPERAYGSFGLSPTPIA